MIKLNFTDQKPLFFKTHNVTKKKYCLVIINNLSTYNQSISVKNSINNTKMRLFILNNTDEVWWRTIKRMESSEVGVFNQTTGRTEN